MKTVYIFVYLITIINILSSCQNIEPRKEEKRNELIKKYLSYAENADTPVARRLHYAHFSDSIAVAHHLKSRGNSLRVLALVNLASGYKDQALQYFKTAATYAKQQNDKHLAGLSLNNVGAVYHQQGQYDSAIKYYNAALIVFDSNMSAYKAMTIVNTGIIHKERGQYDIALQKLLWGAKILDSINDHANLAYAYNSIGNVFNEISSFEKALEYHGKTLDIHKTTGDTLGIARTLNNIGNTYKYMKAYQRALNYYNSSLKWKRMVANKASIAITLNNIASVQFSIGHYKDAEQYYNEALAIRTKSNDIDGIMTTANGLTELYLATNRLFMAKSTALFILDKGNGPGIGLLRHRLRNYLLLVDIYKSESMDKQALDYSIKGHQLKDSIFSQDMALAVSEMEAKYKTKEQEVKLLLAGEKEVVQTKKLVRQKNYIISLSVAAILLLIITYLVYRLSKQRKKSKERNEVLLHELNHRVKNNLQIITDILQLQAAGSSNPVQKNTIQSIRSKVHSVNMIHKLLLDTGYHHIVNAKAFINELTEHLFSIYESQLKQLNTSWNIDEFNLPINQAIPLGLIINELLTNIFKHHNLEENSSQLDINLLIQNNQVQLRIIVYPSLWNKALAIRNKGTGLFLIEILTQQLKGDFTIHNDNKKLLQILKFDRIM